MATAKGIDGGADSGVATVEGMDGGAGAQSGVATTEGINGGASGRPSGNVSSYSGKSIFDAACLEMGVAGAAKVAGMGTACAGLPEVSMDSPRAASSAAKAVVELKNLLAEACVVGTPTGTPRSEKLANNSSWSMPAARSASSPAAAASLPSSSALSCGPRAPAHPHHICYMGTCQIWYKPRGASGRCGGAAGWRGGVETGAHTPLSAFASPPNTPPPASAPIAPMPLAQSRAPPPAHRLVRYSVRSVWRRRSAAAVRACARRRRARGSGEPTIVQA